MIRFAPGWVCIRLRNNDKQFEVDEELQLDSPDNAVL